MKGIINNIKERQKEYYTKNSIEIKLKKKKWREEHPEYSIKYRKENSEREKKRATDWRINNLEKSRLILKKSRLKNKYGISIEKYESMLKVQNYVCAICLKKETTKTYKKVKELSVDHNHTTGEVRDLLCDRCNKTIGLLQEDTVLAKKIIKYLIKWNKQN